MHFIFKNLIECELNFRNYGGIFVDLSDLYVTESVIHVDLSEKNHHN